MNLEDYRILFIIVTLVTALVVVSPVLAVVLPFGEDKARFSEFWLLGPDHMVDGFPSNVSAGEEYSVFVGVGNHMGNSEYYMINVKFGNSTQSLPNIEGGVASSLSPIYDYRFFIGDDEVWETPLTFGFGDVNVEGDVLSVGNVVINGASFPVDASAQFNDEVGGFVFQLFFELWRYNIDSGAFVFHNRYVGLWVSVIEGF